MSEDRTTSSSSSVNKLHVPRHSHSGSAVLNNSAPTHFLGSNSKLHNSALRLSRVNTHNTEHVITDAQSVRPTDRLPSAKPNVTHLDKLWTQIDVLDDVKNMLSLVRQKGSFFNDDLNAVLGNLKQQQNSLLDVIASQLFNSLSDKEHRKQMSLFGGEGVTMGEALKREKGEEGDVGSRATSPPSNAPSRPISHHPLEKKEHSDQSKQAQIDRFFENDDLSKFSLDVLYRKQNFEEMNQYVDEIRNGLESVLQSMKKFDETTKEMW